MDAKACGYTQQVVGSINLVEPNDALRQDQADVLLEPLLCLTHPMLAMICLNRMRVEVNHTFAYLDREGRRIIGKGIECASAGQIKLGVMPMTGENAVLDGAAMQGEAHVGAAVVEGKDTVSIDEDQHSASGSGDHFVMLTPEFLKGVDADGSFGS